MINTVNLPPFKRMCFTIGNLPSSFMESMTYYEALVWLYNYFEKTLLPAINTNSEAITELQQAFVTLKNYIDNYFDNLDVQTEINNKLDAMAESGELTEMITAYLQMSSMLTYNSVAEMAASENLIDGSFVKTFGFYNYKDGGGSLYKIREITNQDTIDGVTLVAVYDENLVAELVYDVCDVKQFGAKGDGETDDTNAIVLALSKNKNIVFPSGDYVVSETIDLDNDDFIIFGNNATIKPSHTGDCFNVDGDNITIDGLNIDGGANYGYDVNGNYCTIKNCTIKNTLYNAIMITGSHNTIDNITAIDCGWDAVGNYGDASYNIIQNSNAIRCKRHGFSTDPNTNYISFINCYCENIGNPSLDEGHSCYHFEYSNNGVLLNCRAYYDENHINNTTQGTYSNYVGVRADHSENTFIDGFKLEYSADYAPLNASRPLTITNNPGLRMINSYLINNSSNANVGVMYTGSNISIENCKLYNIAVSEQDGYLSQIKVLKGCDIELVTKEYFVKFVYMLENAIITDNKFKGTASSHFLVGNFVGCVIKNNIFDTAYCALWFDRDTANNSSKSRNNTIEDCTFKDCERMINYLYGENGTNYLNRCIFKGTCDYVIVANYNWFYMTNCMSENLTVNTEIGYAYYGVIFSDLKSEWDYTPRAFNPNNNARYRLRVNNSGNVVTSAD